MSGYIKGETADFVSELCDNTLGKIEKVGDDVLIFHDHFGAIYVMYAEKDPKYEIFIENIDGDINHLIGIPICAAIFGQLIPKESDKISIEPPLPIGWTKYKQARYILSTDKGGVIISWVSAHDGNYSAQVLFEEISHSEYENLCERIDKITVYKG